MTPPVDTTASRLDNHQLRAIVKSVDPAATIAAWDASSPRPQRLLATILTPAPATDRRRVRNRRPRRSRRWVLVGTLAFVPLAAAVLVPGLVGSNPAYATWTSVPLAVNNLPAAERSCRALLAPDVAVPRPPLANTPEGTRWATPADLAASTASVAERRGTWNLLVMTTPDGFEGVCLMDDAQSPHGMGSTLVRHVTGLKPFQVTPLGWIQGGDGGYDLVSGHAGADVTEVWVRDGLGLAVKATVTNGYYAAWWPDSAQPLIHRDPTLTIVLSDGTTESGISPRGSDGTNRLPAHRPSR